ncbi:MAG: hypothetical protein K2N87_12190 [Eubacterium sp.]|nr:hypothetical protein [Eubacterium sp.]
MEIIISANQDILAMVSAPQLDLSKNMSEEAYWEWVLRSGKGEARDESRVQEIQI